MKIIAEIGSNVKSLEDCRKSIEMAAEAGADAVKFQHFTDYDMFGFNLGNTPSIAEDMIPTLKSQADKCGVEFSCTFFSPEKLRRNSGMLDFIKIASSDMLYEEMLQQAKDLKKMVLLSTGGHDYHEIKEAVKLLDKRRLILMYCESEYPAKETDLDKLLVLEKIHKKLGVSDHSLDIYQTPVLARDRGALYLEKHVNFLDYQDTPDAPHSLTRKQFADMVKKIEGKKRIHLLSPGEHEMISLHNRRCVASKGIIEGEKLEYGVNFGYYRSIIPEVNPILSIKDVEGKTAKRPIKQGQSITERYI